MMIKQDLPVSKSTFRKTVYNQLERIDKTLKRLTVISTFMAVLGAIAFGGLTAFSYLKDNPTSITITEKMPLVYCWVYINDKKSLDHELAIQSVRVPEQDGCPDGTQGVPVE